MKSLINWWQGPASNSESSPKHGKPVGYCCSDTCKQVRQICECQTCQELHRGHIVMPYRKFKQVYSNVMNQIQTRKSIQEMIREYHEGLVEGLERVLFEEGRKFMEEVDKKIFGRKFMEIYSRESTGKSFYSFLPEFVSSCAEEAVPLIQKQINERQKKIIDELRRFMSANMIMVEQKIVSNIPRIRNDPSQTKIQRVKSLLPFNCQLTSKFQASRHRFQTNNLHKLNIRGPILLVAESYKGKIFGGFSPKMFPKGDSYEEDNRCQSFLFSLDHRVLLPLKQQYKKFAIKGGSNLWFGRGDLVIADQCNKANISWAHIGRAYQLPASLKSNEEQWLAGSLYFSIVEYEIYEVEMGVPVGK